MNAENIKHESFPVLEMSCAACAVSVESMLKATTGVKDAGVNYANQSAWVTYDNTVATPEDLREAVRSIGYDLVVDAEDPQAVKEEARQQYYNEIKQRTIGSAVLALPVFVMGMFFMDMPYGRWISMMLTAPVVFYFGRSFFSNAYKQARHGSANMDTLVALSTGVAFLFSAFNTIFPAFWHARGIHAHVYYEAAAVVIAFISLGKLMEERAKSNTSSAIRKLMGLQPKTVHIIMNGAEKELPVTALAIHDTVVIKPGERIPVDGVVTAGSSFVDESMISGEPVAVEKMAGKKVFAGTINQKGSFQFEAQKVGSDTFLAHIIKMVQAAQGSKAPVQKLVDKIAGIFVPIVMALALITFTAWMLLGGENAFTHALLTSITVLVIACPCALGLATPTAIMVGVGKGAENNILIKDAESLERAHRVNAVVFDKTGTLTEGRPTVTELIWINPDNRAFSAILFALEAQSEHPLAEAVINRLKDENVNGVMLTAFESITGSGVRAQYNNQYFYVGNAKLLDDNNIIIAADIKTQVATLQHQAKTVVYFTDDKTVLAIIAIADLLKATAVTAIKTLQAANIEVYMLTGDNEQTAKAIAREVGIQLYKAEVLPGDKADFITSLQRQGRIVAMVGDGINDSQALVQADVSIAMGKGSDIAMDSARITLITSDLEYVSKAIKLSSQTVRCIRQNLFWAFVYNAIGIPIAAGILYPVNGFLLDPMIAGAAMALSSVSVVSNSLRLKWTKI